MRALLLSVSLLAACGEPASDALPDAAVADAGEASEQGAGVLGKIVDEDGENVGVFRVLACQTRICQIGETQSDGRFRFVTPPPAQVALKTHEDTAHAPQYGAILYPATIAGDQPIDLGTLYLPRFGEGAMVGPASADPQVLAIGDGVELTVSRREMMVPVGASLSRLAARKIREDRYPSPPGLSEEILAVYALRPFTAKSARPIKVRVELPLPAGTRVQFRTLSELDGTMSEPAFGGSDGTYVITDEGAGIDNLTWLIISR